RESLFAGAIALPLAMLFACVSASGRKHIANWLWLAPLPALTAAIFGSWNLPLILTRAPISLMLDTSGCVLMMAASALWIAAGASVPGFFRGKRIGGSFPVCWLLTLIGSIGIFLAADLASFLVFYALVSLPAYGLVIYYGTHAGER